VAGTDGLFEDDRAEVGQDDGGCGSAKVVFKPSHRGECYLLPPSLDELIGPENLVRFVDAVVDRLDLSWLIEQYKGGGASAYHPATLLKIWLFGWCRRVYTARPLAAALRRDVEFMWLAGEQRPSFVTLADFRRRLNGTIKEIFKEVVGLAIRAGMVRKEEIYIDHTKMEANSNRHRVVWRKSIEKYLSRAEAELDLLLELIDRLNEEEEIEPEEQPQIGSLTPQMMDELIEGVNQRVRAGEKERSQATAEKRQLRRGKDRLEARHRYQSLLGELDGRNSMAKSDPESTAMMMKDGVTIRPGYNLGIASENGIVVGYDVSNNSNDSMSFKPVLEHARSTLGSKPKRVCADAGYGSIENYVHLEDEGIDCYVKYPGWDRDLKGTRRRFEAESFTYDEDNDRWICAQGEPLSFVKIEKFTNRRTGYVDTRRRYQADEAVCAACPVKDDCTRGRARSLHISPDIRRHRRRALENLAGPMGVRMRSLRGVEVETPFGVQKHAYRFRRYHLRGLAGAEIESGLFLSAFNLRRLHAVFLRYMMTGARPAVQITSG
jgi:transposase